MVFVLQFLIGYNRGLIVLWDNEASNADQTYNSTQVSVDLQPTKNPSLSNVFVKEYKPICYELNPEILPKDTQVNNSPQCVRICNEKKRWKLWILWFTWCTCFLQQLESLSWHRNGTEFMSAHNDGSYIIWSSTNSAEPKDPALTPYGKE